MKITLKELYENYRQDKPDSYILYDVFKAFYNFKNDEKILEYQSNEQIDFLEEIAEYDNRMDKVEQLLGILP